VAKKGPTHKASISDSGSWTWTNQADKIHKPRFTKTKYAIKISKDTLIGMVHSNQIYMPKVYSRMLCFIKKQKKEIENWHKHVIVNWCITSKLRWIWSESS
jgi:adenine specific DNA methylase Mod